MFTTKVFKDASILILAALVFSSISWAHWNAKEQILTPNEVATFDLRLKGSDVVWVDARSRSDYDKGHVPGAVLLNEDGWDALLEGVFEKWKPERPVVVYCAAGCQLSEKVAQKLRDLGIEPVYFLRGGYDAWKQAHHQGIL